MFRYAIPAISWTLFFVFTVAIVIGAIRVDLFKGFLVILLFVTAVFSTMFVSGYSKKN